MSLNRKIGFFYPARKIGGAQLLFARLAVEFISQGYEVVVIDYEDGFLNFYIKEEGFQFELIVYNDNPIVVSEDLCIVQHLSSVHKLSKKIKFTPNSTFVFWSIHPHNILALSLFTPLYTRSSYSFISRFSKIFEPLRRMKTKNLLSDLNEKSAIYYMDESNFRPSRDVGYFDEDVEYLPIPIVDKEGCKKRNYFKTTNFAWIGRITGEKVKPFNRIVNDLDNCEGAEAIRFHVIGYGELGVLNKVKNIEVVNHGIVSKNDLDNILLNEIDCVFAMGTSVLESAVLSIPSVLCDLSKRKIPKNYKYKFVYDTKNYSLGTEAHRFTGKLEIRDIVKLMANEEEYKRIALKCYEYSKDNHSMNVVAGKLLDAITKSTFTTLDLNRYY